LPPEASPEDLARFYAVMIKGIALQAQHGGTRDELLRVVDVAMANWPARMGGGSGHAPLLLDQSG
jgi:hypothetical protein